MIYILGSTGQLGHTLAKCFDDQPVHLIDRSTLNLSSSASIQSFCDQLPEKATLVNGMAYTAVDAAETNPDECYQINTHGVRELAQKSAPKKTRIIHISTDYVFDGKNSHPYKESDQTSPLSIYGKSKLEGERELLEYSYSAIILRTSWLYSEFNKNFLLTILNLAQKNESLRIVDDQIGSPTYAFDLAKAIKELMDKIPYEEKLLLHYSAEGKASWCDFAQMIVEEKKIPCEIKPIPTKEYPTPAARPAYSVLDKTLVQSYLMQPIDDWKKGVVQCLKKISS